jgi:hypothetical protein
VARCSVTSNNHGSILAKSFVNRIEDRGAIFDRIVSLTSLH